MTTHEILPPSLSIRGEATTPAPSALGASSGPRFIKIQNTPRSQDDELLHMIALRCAGWGCTAIGRLYGRTASYVRRVTRKVEIADEQQSGENIKGAYWS